VERQDLIEYFLKEYYPRGEAAYRLPVSIAVNDIWPEILRARRARAVELSVSSWDGHAYWYVPTEKFLRAGDEFVEAVRDETISQLPQYAHNEGIIDEAYYSSVIEGAYTTCQRAREFIASGQPPKDKSERMVLNNYEALRFALQNLDAPIDEKIILEIGRILTEGTLDEGVNAGYRNGDVQVVSGRQEVVYIAPDARYVKPMMKELIEYIADENIHPVVRACVAHIYLVTIHPFADKIWTQVKDLRA